MNIKNLFSSLFGAKSGDLPDNIKGKVRDVETWQDADTIGNIPDDIKGKVREIFPDEADQDYILQQLGTLWRMPLNVGPAQLARAILVLSGSSRSRFDALFDGDFMGDPRDLLVSAEEKSGNPGHYGSAPFGLASSLLERQVANLVAEGG